MKQKEPISLGDRGIHFPRDDARRHIVHHDQTVDGLRVVLGETGSDARAPIVPHEGNLLDAERRHECSQILRHVSLVVAERGLVCFAVAAQVRRDDAIVLSQFGNLKSPGETRFGKAM
jgi:hypothetical protein